MVQNYLNVGTLNKVKIKIKGLYIMIIFEGMGNNIYTSHQKSVLRQKVSNFTIVNVLDIKLTRKFCNSLQKVISDFNITLWLDFSQLQFWPALKIFLLIIVTVEVNIQLCFPVTDENLNSL